ncbi:MAG TPA: hypothetical protein VIR30_04915 [Nocardioides sp.]
MSSPLPQSRVPLQRIAEAAVEQARLRVVPRLASDAPRVPFVTLVSLLLVAGVVGLLLFNTTMQQNSFAATDLEKQARDLTSREQTLQMQLEELRNPQSVAEKAQSMGMVPASNPAFIELSSGQVIGQATPATTADRTDVRPPAAQKPEELAPPVLVIKVKADKPERDTTSTSQDRRGGRDRTGSTSQSAGDRSER